MTALEKKALDEAKKGIDKASTELYGMLSNTFRDLGIDDATEDKIRRKMEPIRDNIFKHMSESLAWINAVKP